MTIFDVFVHITFNIFMAVRALLTARYRMFGGEIAVMAAAAALFWIRLTHSFYFRVIL